MSAFVVSKSHIDLMVRAALKSRPVGDPGHSGPFRFWRTDENGAYAGWYEIDPCAEDRVSNDYTHYITPSQAGEILVSENVRSVSYCYSDVGRDAGDLPGPIDAYYMAPYIYTEPRRDLSPGEVFKAIDCLDYQSCEHPSWRASEAFSFCEALRDAYCRRVSDYESAPWEFSEVPA